MKEIRKLTTISVLAILIAGVVADYVYDGLISRSIVYQPVAYAARWITYQIGGYIVIDGLTIYLNPGDRVITPTLLGQGTWEPIEPGFPFWPWHDRSIHPRCPAYQVFSRCTLHITSAGRPQGPSVRSQTLIEWAERHSGRHCSLPNLFGAENC